MDLTAREKAVAKQAAKMLRQELMQWYPAFARRKTKVGPRDKKSFIGNVRVRMKQGFLDRLIIDTTKYSFHLHYGYDLLPKSEWERRRRRHENNPKPPERRDVPGTLHFSKVLNNSPALNWLADQITQIRFIQVGHLIKKL